MKHMDINNYLNKVFCGHALTLLQTSPPVRQRPRVYLLAVAAR
jgi:hypothetical protein